MSNAYYVGIYRKRKDGIYEVDKPIDITGTTKIALSYVLECCCIDMERNFSYCCTDDRHNPLFYKEEKWYMSLPEWEKESIMDIEAMQYMDEMGTRDSSKYPLICDGTYRDGVAYFIVENLVIKPNYINFKDKFKSKGDFKSYLSGDIEYSQFVNNLQLLDNLWDNYSNIAKWIKNNEYIYLYKYY